MHHEGAPIALDQAAVRRYARRINAHVVARLRAEEVVQVADRPVAAVARDAVARVQEIIVRDAAELGLAAETAAAIADKLGPLLTEGLEEHLGRLRGAPRPPA